MCIPWELNPQPFALLTQCSTTEPQENIFNLMEKHSISQNAFPVDFFFLNLYFLNIFKSNWMKIFSSSLHFIS